MHIDKLRSDFIRNFISILAIDRKCSKLNYYRHSRVGYMVILLRARTERLNLITEPQEGKHMFRANTVFGLRMADSFHGKTLVFFLRNPISIVEPLCSDSVSDDAFFSLSLEQGGTVLLLPSCCFCGSLQVTTLGFTMYQQEVLRLQGKMAASQFHTVIIDKDNRAFGFGQSANGALGLATEGDDMLDTSAVAPSRLAFKNTELKKLMDDESKPKDVRVGCTDDGTVLLVDGLVFQLGRQRPIGATEAYEPGPMEQKLDFKTQGRYASKKNQLIKAVACGNSFSVAIAQDVPDLFVWGRPAFSEKLFQIEKGAEISVPRPFKINEAKSPIIQVMMMVMMNDDE
eukprot:g65229.t1